MEKINILRYLTFILSLPFIILSRIAYSLGLWGIRKDTALCLGVIDEKSTHFIMPVFLDALIIAEDRRNSIHKGIDPISVIRAAYINMSGKGFQGASTIEQQFVRTVCNRYERSIYRKFREQLLAVSVARLRSKVCVSNAYLLTAYYGHKSEETHEALKSSRASISEAAKIISKLKYPEPKNDSYIWRKKHKIRSKHIASLLEISANKANSANRWSGVRLVAFATNETPRNRVG